ncbi:MAG: copper chaperone PCu(A)C [Hyphomicrobium sp.]
MSPKSKSWRTPRLAMAELALAACFAASVASPAPAHEAKIKNLQIVHPNAVEPAGAGPADVAVSMTIRNHGRKSDRLTGASSPLSGSVTIEGTSGANVIDIPAGETVKLSSKSVHIKLRNVKDQLTGYDMFPLTLTFETAGSIEIEVMVEEGPSSMTGHDEEVNQK